MKCCIGCTERWIEGTKRCHDTCERHQAELAEHRAEKEKIREAKRKEREGDLFHMLQVQKTKRQVGHHCPDRRRWR